jgi:hypothetical protein
VRGDDVRHAVQDLGQVATHVGVPRVRVGEVDPAEPRDHRQVDAQRLQRGVGVPQAGRDLVRDRLGLVARRAEAVHLDVDDLPQRRHQVADVHAGAPVDVRGVLAGEQTDAHAQHRSAWGSARGRAAKVSSPGRETEARTMVEG